MLLCTVFMEPPHGLRHYFRTHFLDTTFKGLYKPNGFDFALLIPYFIVLILLAFYGMHRYQLVYLYYKHRKNKTTDPPSRFAEAPHPKGRRRTPRADPVAAYTDRAEANASPPPWPGALSASS